MVISHHHQVIIKLDLNSNVLANQLFVQNTYKCDGTAMYDCVATEAPKNKNKCFQSSYIVFKSQNIEFKGLSKNKSVLQDETCTHAFLTVATVGVLCGSPGVLQTGKPWGAITEDVQHLCPQVRWELKNIPNDILSRALKFTSAAAGSISYSLSEVFSREKPVTMLSSFTVTYYSCLEPDKHQQLADLGQ